LEDGRQHVGHDLAAADAAALLDDVQRGDSIGLGHRGEIEDIVDVGVEGEFAHV
jgi:hypothetical protein